MIWPSTLMSAAMFTTLHKEENKAADGWTITRWNFFYIVFVSGFSFYFLPGLLMPAPELLQRHHLVRPPTTSWSPTCSASCRAWASFP